MLGLGWSICPTCLWTKTVKEKKKFAIIYRVPSWHIQGSFAQSCSHSESKLICALVNHTQDGFVACYDLPHIHRSSNIWIKQHKFHSAFYLFSFFSTKLLHILGAVYPFFSSQSKANINPSCIIFCFHEVWSGIWHWSGGGWKRTHQDVHEFPSRAVQISSQPGPEKVCFSSPPLCMHTLLMETEER